MKAIFYLLQSGCQWRMLPRDLPSRSTIYGDFWRWLDNGKWALVHDVLYQGCHDLEEREESPSAAILDTESVKTGPDARDLVGFDAGKKVKGRNANCSATRRTDDADRSANHQAF